MASLARRWVWIIGVVAALGLAGCGRTAGGGAGPGAGPAQATATTATAPVLTTATAAVGGHSETILADAHGMTLYYFDPDTASTPTCTQSCTWTWPPLLVDGGALQAPSGVTGTLKIVSGANGKQVEYNGHPLYTYSGDKQPGQTTGDGIEGKWHVATPTVAVNAGATPPSNPYGGPGGY